jgi:hypothetical protein
VMLASLVSELKGLQGGLAAQQAALTDFIAETNAERTQNRAAATQSREALKKAPAPVVVVVDDKDTIVEQPTLKAKKNRKFYAVAKGHSTGIFHSWRVVAKVIKDYPGAIHKRFRSEATAQAWLDDRHLPRDQESRSGGTWDTRVEGLDDIPEEVACEPTLEDVRRTSLLIDQIVNLSTIGPDPSTGKAKEIYGQSLQVEPEVLNLLCPKGVTASVRKDIMETTIDVSSLPGKFTSNNNVHCTMRWGQGGAMRHPTYAVCVSAAYRPFCTSLCLFMPFFVTHPPCALFAVSFFSRVIFLTK